MKKQIVGIVILMLVATTVVSATNINVKENIKTTTSGADVPVWRKGDSWTYNMHEIMHKYTTNDTSWFTLYCNCTLTQTVIDVTGNTYTMKWTSTNNEGRATIGSYRLKFTPFTKFTGVVVLRKTDLAGLSETHQETGFAFWLIGNILPIPAQYMYLTQWVFTTPVVYLPFPMNAGTNGTFPSFQYTYQEKCSLYRGLISLINMPVKSYTSSAEHYYCEMANITVPKGTYNAYNVSVDTQYGLGHTHIWRYYVPKVGFQAKLYENYDWDSTGRPGDILTWELVSTTYTP